MFFFPWGFGSTISSAAPSLGGTLTTGFGTTQGLGSSAFGLGQQPSTGTIFVMPVYFKGFFKEEKLNCET